MLNLVWHTDQQIDLHWQWECLQSAMQPTLMKSNWIGMDRLDHMKIKCIKKEMHTKMWLQLNSDTVKCDGLSKTTVFASSFRYACFKTGYQPSSTIVRYPILCKGILLNYIKAFSSAAAFTLRNWFVKYQSVSSESSKRVLFSVLKLNCIGSVYTPKPKISRLGLDWDLFLWNKMLITRV